MANRVLYRCFSCQAGMSLDRYKKSTHCEACGGLCMVCRCYLDREELMFCEKHLTVRKTYCKRCRSVPSSKGGLCSCCIKKVKRLETKEEKIAVVVPSERDVQEGVTKNVRSADNHTKKTVSGLSVGSDNKRAASRWMRGERDLEKQQEEMEREYRFFSKDPTRNGRQGPREAKPPPIHEPYRPTPIRGDIDWFNCEGV